MGASFTLPSLLHGQRDVSVSVGALDAAIVHAIRSDAVNDIAAQEFLETKRLIVQRIARHGRQIIRHERRQRGRDFQPVSTN